MKKLAVAMLIAAMSISVAGCGSKEPTENAPVGTEAEIMDEPAVEEDGPGIEADEIEDNEIEKDVSSEEPEEDSIWQQCLDMDENAVIDKYPELSINGVAVSTDWTLKDFLESGAIDDAASITVKTMTEVDGGFEYGSVEPTLEELKAGMNGIGVDIIGENVSLFFDLSRAHMEESADFSVLDVPVVEIMAGGSFNCQGITPESTYEDVANTFGPTHAGSDALYYKYKDTDGYVSFSKAEGMPMEIFVDINR